MVASIFSFEQLGGDRLKVELADHAAPFGRPRQGAVTKHEEVYRQSKTRYPGANLPTRHIFGVKAEPVVLNGRWRDSRGGQNFAQAKFRQLQLFCQGQQRVRITWGNVYSVIAFITRLKVEIESPAEFVWEIEYDVDDDLLFAQKVQVITPKSPRILAAAILEEELRRQDILNVPQGMKGNVFDALDSLISSLNSVSATLVSVANDIDSYAHAPFQALARLRGGISQYGVAIAKLRSTYDYLKAEAALDHMSADWAQTFWDVKSAWHASSLEAIREADKAERDAVRAQRGQLLALYTAKDGDTWERIALNFYGSSDRAGEIQEVNGVSPGQNPVPGTDYFIPR